MVPLIPVLDVIVGLKASLLTLVFGIKITVASVLKVTCLLHCYLVTSCHHRHDRRYLALLLKLYDNVPKKKTPITITYLSTNEVNAEPKTLEDLNL